jgi:quercetin dioxygenase-like cupin family protein
MKSARIPAIFVLIFFFLLIVLIPVLAHIAHAQPPAPAAPVVVTYAPPKDPAVLHTTFVDFDSLPTTGPRAVFDNPTITMDKLEVHITTLDPGKVSHPIHRHPWEEIIYVRDGQVDFNINGITHHAGPGAFAFFASNDPHNVRNVGATPATYYVLNFVSDTASSPAAANAPSAATRNLPGKLASTVIDTNSLQPIVTAVGSHVTVVDSPTITLVTQEAHLSTLLPGKHSAIDIVDPNDEIVIIRSGQVEVTVNGISSRMNAGSLLYWYPNDKRTLRNVGPTPTSYLVIRATSDKSPKPPPPATH